MKLLKLTNGYIAKIDTEDFDKVNQYNWYYVHKGKKYYSVQTYVKKLKKVKIISLHRFIMNFPVNMTIDHINGNTLDNRKSNLRICTRAENNKNRRKIKGVSKYKGVHFSSKNRWRARIKVNNKLIHLGSFKTEIDAAKSYNEAAELYYKEFANLNVLN